MRPQRRSSLLCALCLLADLAWGCAPGVAGSPCNSDFDCGNGFFCNGSGICQQSSVICQSFENCGENQICASGVCVNGCRMDGCPSGQTCNDALDQCVALVVDEGDTGTSGGQGSSTSAGGSSSGTAGTTTYGLSTTGSGSTGTSTGSAVGSGSSAVGSATGSGSSTGRTGSTSASSSGTTTGGAACTADTWANFAGTFFTTYCNDCHNWTKATVAKDASVAKELKGGFMPPPKDKQPSAQDLNRILTWIGCGEP